MSGHDIVKKSQQFNVLAQPQVNTGFGSVSCPDGKVVIGGGYSITGAAAGQVVVTASYPDANNGWKVNFQNAGNDAASFTAEVYAVCVYVQ